MREVVKRNLKVGSRKANLLQALKQPRYFWLSMVTLLLSVYFPVVECQLITLAALLGIKWIVDDVSTRINILITERGHENGYPRE